MNIFRPFTWLIEQQRKGAWQRAERRQSDSEYAWSSAECGAAQGDRIILRTSRLQVTVSGPSISPGLLKVFVYEWDMLYSVIDANAHIRFYDERRDGPWITGEQLLDPTELAIA